MSFGSNTETRILEMQLENKDFEAGVRQTIQSLENLEEKLNLKNAGDGFEKVSAAANSVQMSHLESGIDAVTNKFTLMGQIGLQVLERISTQVVNTSERILRAATIQPMIDGWGEFEMKTGSIQTILGGIRHDFEDQPTAIHAISEALDELNEYADKTIYNFAQMTENVGKFTNQGLDLEVSTNAIKGIANWAAAVGANPQQMSRAMYNISQSLGAGSMQLIDWRSIRFANMATPEVKKLFAEVAKKMNPDVFDKNGKVKVGKKKLDVLEDFESSLKAGWLTNDVMAEAFGIYAKAFSEEELIAKYGEELGKQFYEMGEYAEEAATKVRTFSQLMSVLKEGLGSGWAQSFDIILGGFEKQTEFFTAIKDKIEEITNFQTEDRNAWLTAFSNIGGVDAFQQSILNTIDILSDFYWVFNDVISLVVNPFGWTSFNMSDGIFGPKQQGYTEMKDTWVSVKEIFDDINRTMGNFRKWMYEPDKKTGKSPINNLANALSGVAGAAGIAWQVLTGFGKMVFRLFKRFEPLVDSVLSLLGQIGATIYNVFFNLTGQQTIDKIFDKIEGAIGPVIDVVVGLASAVVDLIHSFLGIDKAADDWTVLGDKMKAFWDIFTYDKDLSFADNFRNSLQNALIAVFGQDTANKLIQAWDENVAPVLEQISGFFTKAFEDFNRIIAGLQAAAAADYSQSGDVKGGIATFLQAFLGAYDPEHATETYANILGIYQQIREYYDKNVSQHVDALTEIFTVKLPELNAKIRKFLLGEDTTVITGPGQSMVNHKNGLIDNLLEIFSAENIQSVIDSIKTFFDPIIKVLGDTFRSFSEFLFGQDTTVMTGPGQSMVNHKNGLVDNLIAIFSPENLADVLGAVSTFFQPIIDAISDSWNQLREFLFGHEVTGKQGNTWRQGGIFEEINGYFDGETWEQNWEIIKGAFEEVSSWIATNGAAMWDTIMTFLFGPEQTANLNGPGQAQKFRSGGAYQAALDFPNPVFDWLKEKGEYLYNYITTHNFQQMWQGLNDLLFGYDTIVMTGPGQSMTNHTDGILSPIMTILQPIADVFNQVKSWALDKLSSIDWGGIWESIGTFFTGYDEYVYLEGKGYGYKVHHNSLFENITSFFEQVIAFFQKPEIQSIIGHVEKVLGWIGGLGGELWGAFEGLFEGKGFGGFEGVGNYLLNGFNKLKEKIFPEGFDLGGILGGLFGGNGAKDASAGAAGNTASDQSGGFLGFLKDGLSSLLVGKADAAEADATAIADEANAVVATLSSAAQSTEKAASEGTSLIDSIIGSVSPLLPYLGAGAAIGVVGKVSDMITGITGNRKPTILEQISGLIRSFGEVFKGIGVAIAAAGFAEWVSPGSIDKVFTHLNNILQTVFKWVGGIAGVGTVLSAGLTVGGNALTKSMFGQGDGAKVAESMNFDKVSTIISSIGTGIQGLFEGLQTMYNLVWEIAGADFLMGFDENGVANFDKKLDRVLGLVGKILLSLAGSEAITTVVDAAKQLGVAKIASVLGVEAGTESMSKILIGLGSFVEAAGQGISAIMTASIVPGFLSIDIDKFTNFVNAVLLGLSGLLTSESILSAVNNLESKGGQSTFWLAKLGEVVDVAVLTAFFGAIATVARYMMGWYLEMAEEHLTTMAPAIYTFVSNLTGALQLLADLGSANFAAAEQIMSTDLPRLLGYIDPEKLGYDKETLDEVGSTIRDFGNRVYSGISRLASAKDVFDKYSANGDDRQFPLEFFQEMTEALTYLQGDGIKELYDSVFGQGGFFVGNTNGKEPDLDGLNSFFNTIGNLGWVFTSHNEIDELTSRSWTQVESTKEGIDAFQDAFSGIQQSFHSLIGDITTKDYSTDKINALADFLTKIADAGHTFSKSFFYESGATKVFENTSPVTQFAGWLKSMGDGIRQLNDALTNDAGQYDINYTQIESALKALQPMAEIEKTLYEYSQLTVGNDGKPSRDWMANTQKWIDEVLPRMQSIGSQLHAMAAEISPEDVAALTGASGTLTSLSSFMSQDFYTNISTMTTEQIGAYASAFGDLKKSLIVEDGSGTSLATMIQQVFDQIGNKEVQLKITPVIDDTNFSTNLNLPENVQLGNEYSRNITLQVNMTDIQKVQIVDAQISELVTANHETRDRLESLARSISNLRVNVTVPGYGGSLRGGARTVEAYPLVAAYQLTEDIPDIP